MLTQEGQEAARECIKRSGLNDSSLQLSASNRCNNSLDEQPVSRLDSTNREPTFASSALTCPKEPNNVSVRVRYIP